jgi:hypothetical protein
MSKIYSPEEVARAVLKRCQELANQSKLVKKEICESSKEEDAKDAAEEHKKKDKSHKETKEKDKKAKEHKEKEMEKCGDMEKSAKHKEKEVEKCGDMKKSSKLKEWIKKKKKTDLKKMFGRTATSAEGSIAPPPPPPPGTSIADQIGFGKAQKMDKCGTMSKEESLTSKAVGLKPMTSDKVKPPKADEMPPKPKAATTLKNYMEKRKK